MNTLERRFGLRKWKVFAGNDLKKLDFCTKHIDI